MLDTVVTPKNIKSYYDGFKPDFLLDKPVVECAYVILPVDAPQYYTFRNRFRSQYENKQTEINKYIEEHAKLYYQHNNKFMYVSELAKQVPIATDNIENLLKYNRFIELKDEDYIYLIKIFDYKLKSNVAPLNIVENEIRNILLNKRKIQLVRNLEKDIMNDARNNKKIEIKS